MAILKDLIVHGSSRFLNKIYANELETSTFEADSAIIKKLKADDATVVGLLDVQGQLHTSSWTNSNIATIDGSFYITPTIECASGTLSSLTASTGTPPKHSFVLVPATGNSFAVVNSLYYYDTSAHIVTWAKYSKVLITGEILVGGEWIPLGTILGQLNADGASDSISIFNGQNNKHGTSTILAELTSTNITSAEFRNLKISLYQRSGNTTTNTDAYKYPLGIFLTALGQNGKTFIDIYGGGNSYTTQYGGYAIPNVRIGNLSGLPVITTAAGNFAPVGWGIYTTNGYFRGTVIADQGVMGGWRLTSDSIYSGNSAFGNASGMYFGASGISLGSTFKVTNTGVLTATAGKIGGFDIGASCIKNTKTSYSETTYDGVWVGTDGIGLGKGLFYVTPTGALTAKSGSIAGWSFNASQLYKTNTTPGYNASTMVLSTGTSSTYDIGGTTGKTWMISAGKGFGVTTTGALYCNDAHVSGEITATSGEIGGINITNGKLDVSAINIGDLSGEIGGRNLILGTAGERSTRASTNGSVYVSPTPVITGYGDTVLNNTSDYFTYSFDYEVTGNTASEAFIYVRIRGASVNGSSKGYYSYVKDAPVGKHCCTFKLTTAQATVGGNLNAGIRLRYATDGAVLTVKNIKLEKGTKATDWTPAPQDVENRIVDAGNTANNYIFVNSDGIKIADVNPETATYYQLQTSSGTSFFVGDNKRSEITANGFYIYDDNSDNSQIASFDVTTLNNPVIILGKINGKNIKINNDGITINKGSTQIASYKDSIILGDEANNNLLFLDKSSLSLRSGVEDFLSGNEVFEVGECAETISKTVTSGQASYQWSELTNNTKEIKEVTLNEELLKEGIDYTFDLTTGTITLTNAPSNNTAELKVSFIPMNPEEIQKTITLTTPEEEYWLLRSLYSIPQHVTNIFSISLNGTVLTSSQYSYDSSTHILTIPATPTENNAPAAGSTVEVVYTKSLGYYYTLGKRDLTKIGDYSIATGYNCMAAGDKSFAGGNYTYVTGQSSFGYGYGTSDADCVQVSGNYCGGIGRGVIVRGTGNFGCGNFNVPSSSYIFSVGNGSSQTNRKNAFWVAKSGNARVAGALSVMKGLQVSGEMRSYIDNNSRTIPMFWYDTKRINNISVPANSTNTNLNCDITMTNHTPMGIVGMRILNSSSSGANAASCNLYIYMIVNNTSEDHITFSVRNFASTAAKIDIEFKIFYIANEALSKQISWT